MPVTPQPKGWDLAGLPDRVCSAPGVPTVQSSTVPIQVLEGSSSVWASAHWGWGDFVLLVFSRPLKPRPQWSSAELPALGSGAGHSAWSSLLLWSWPSMPAFRCSEHLYALSWAAPCAWGTPHRVSVPSAVLMALGWFYQCHCCSSEKPFLTSVKWRTLLRRVLSIEAVVCPTDWCFLILPGICLSLPLYTS